MPTKGQHPHGDRQIEGPGARTGLAPREVSAMVDDVPAELQPLADEVGLTPSQWEPCVLVSTRRGP